RSGRLQRVAVLTGDGELPGRQVALELGVTEVHTNLLPEDKVNKIEEILQSNIDGKVLFVGDGINDAPVLARSDAGIAMGKGGTDAAIESADVVLMTDELSRLPQAIQSAQKTRRIVFQNIFLALGIKGMFLSLGALGYASLWESVLADVGVALLAVINALRALK
ncbi:MAG: HAD-IC family P-type ATPase, partial [Spirochaetales bacterium]